MRRILILWTSFVGNSNKIREQAEVWILACVYSLSHKRSVGKCCSPTTAPGHIYLCAPQKPLQCLARQCWHTHPTAMEMRHQILTYLNARKAVCDGTGTRTTRHYITPCVSCRRENTAKFTGCAYVLLFKDGRLLTMRETVMTHECLSNIVGKSCEIFRYLTYISWNTTQDTLLDA
jgi:hypothetical protein